MKLKLEVLEQNEPMSNLFIITGQNLFAKGVTKGIYISEDIWKQRDSSFLPKNEATGNCTNYCYCTGVDVGGWGWGLGVYYPVLEKQRKKLKTIETILAEIKTNSE